MNGGGNFQCNFHKIVHIWKIQSKIFPSYRKTNKQTNKKNPTPQQDFCPTEGSVIEIGLLSRHFKLHQSADFHPDLLFPYINYCYQGITVNLFIFIKNKNCVLCFFL